MTANRLFDLLTAYEGGVSAFNQYSSSHPDLDRPGSAEARRENLATYLDAFEGATFVLVGEAAGYAGCRFSGIPFTCEAQFAGPDPLAWTQGRTLCRSSTAPEPWVERSARMVWETLGDQRDCLLWNAFPWHPMGKAGPLSNRAPGRELLRGIETLECLLSLFPSSTPVAVGRVAQRALAQLGLDARYVRHPSHGGKSRFVQGVAQLRSPELPGT